MKILYQGIPGSFSSQAVQAFFGSSGSSEGLGSFRAVFEGVEQGRGDVGVLPLENSLAGSVRENIDLMLRYPVKIVGERYLKIEHQLLGLSGDVGEERIRKLTRVFSHAMALAQCEKFFEDHPWLEGEAKGDTAGAAQYVASLKDPNVAAIASSEAGYRYGLSVLKPNIEDSPQNFTRFVIIRREPAGGASNKVSVIFSLPHTAGSLASTLSNISKKGANLSKIESRPITGRPFEYYFYADIEAEQAVLLEVIRDLQKIVPFLQVLGMYQAAEAPWTNLK